MLLRMSLSDMWIENRGVTDQVLPALAFVTKFCRLTVLNS